MFATLLSTKQTGTEIWCRLLKLVQEFIIRHMDMRAKEAYRVKWPKEEFCKQCHDEVNVHLDVETLFDDLQKACASTE